MRVNEAVREGLYERTIRTYRKEGNRQGAGWPGWYEGHQIAVSGQQIRKPLALILGEMGNYWRVVSRGIL